MPSQKRILHLRSKNKLLLDKLESHSSLIRAELKYLKRTIRGTADKSPSCNETRGKNWAKRNNSLQVTEALSSCSKSANDEMPSKYTLHSRGKNRKTTNVECKDENIGRDKETETESLRYPPSKENQAANCKQKLIHRRKDGEDGTNKNSKTIIEIISSIDYSPKSTFIKRMKSKCKPSTREVYCRLSENKGSPSSSFHKEKDAKRKKKKRQVRCVGGTPIRKARIYDVPSTKENPQLSFRKSICPECGKRIESQPITCACENRSSESEEPSDCGIISKRKEERECKDLKRVKKFRERNWQDCYADPSVGESVHCCGHHKCNSVYGINDRLFAVPLDQSCENLVHCPSCPHLNCQQSCCTNSKQVIVTIPTSLLGSDAAMDVDKKKNFKGAKESISIPKELLTKLQRPVPQNSMALRYQKGIC